MKLATAKMKKDKLSFTALFSVAVLSSVLFFSACGKKGTSSSQSNMPHPADSTSQLVMQVSRCARLYTTSYQIHKIVTHEDIVRLKGSILSRPFDVKVPVGERKVAIPIDVTLKAYVDFAGFSADNVERKGGQLVLTLPDPHVEVTASKVDHAGTRQYVDLTRTRYTDEELADFSRQGADSITAHVERFGIIENARRTAVQTLMPMLRRMGYEEANVTIRFRKDFTPRELQRMITIENHPEK